LNCRCRASSLEVAVTEWRNRRRRRRRRCGKLKKIIISGPHHEPNFCMLYPTAPHTV
jgi:hypothetical protein